MSNITGNILKHMIHSEDLIQLGCSGGKLLCDTYDDLLDILQGNTPKGTSKLSIKWDGSPAIVASSDYYGKKFVALKHSWDKGKIFESEESITNEYKDRPDLANKLTLLYRHLDKLHLPKNEIWMGDYLFSKDDIKTIELNGVKYLSFHPNTIVYVVPPDDSIKQADIGIVWHTRYIGEELRINFDVSVCSDVPEVYQLDANYKINSVSDCKSLKESLNNVKEDLKSYYEQEQLDSAILSLIDMYRNSIIKTNSTQFPDINRFVDWIKSREDKDLLARKTDRGKNNIRDKYTHIYNYIDSHIQNITQLWDIQKKVVHIKESIENELNKSNKIKSYIKDKELGYIPISGEGYVVSDDEGNVQKLVNRLEFSRNNWDSNIIKGWNYNTISQN